MTVTVRTARPADREAVGRMLGEFMVYLDAIERSERPAGLIDKLVDLAFGPDPVCVTLIAEQDGRPVGYVGYHPGVWESYRTLYVISLFVCAESRGTGAGTALMDAVKGIARGIRAERLVWEVWSKNRLAVDFYLRIGGVVHDDNLRMSLMVD